MLTSADLEQIREVVRAELRAANRTWFDYEQAAEYTGFGVSTLKAAKARGELRACIDRSHAVRFERAALDEWMRSMRLRAVDL